MTATFLQTSAPAFCVVCHGELKGLHRSTCQMCGGPFCQPWLPESRAARCGRVASHDETLAIVCLCQDCYNHRQSRSEHPL